MRIRAILAVLGACLFFPVRVNADDSIGVLVSLTGNWAVIGENMRQGLTLAAEEVNAKGGLLHRPMQFDFQDTDEEKSGAKVASAYSYLKSRGVRLFIGPTGVPGIETLTPLAQKDDVVIIGPTATNSFYKASPKFFNSSGDNFVTTKAVAERAFARGYRKIAIFGSLQPWENAQAKTFRTEFSRLGGAIVEEVSPEADQTDLRAEALRVVRAKPDAVFFAIFNHVSDAGRAMQGYHYSGAKFAAMMDESHLTGSDGGLEDAEMYLFNPPSAEFIEKFRRRFNKPPGIFADSSYDAGISLAAAITAAGSTDPTSVAQNLARVKFSGSSGENVGYDADGLINRGITLNVVRGSTVLPKNP